MYPTHKVTDGKTSATPIIVLPDGEVVDDSAVSIPSILRARQHRQVIVKRFTKK